MPKFLLFSHPQKRYDFLRILRFLNPSILKKSYLFCTHPGGHTAHGRIRLQIRPLAVLLSDEFVTRIQFAHEPEDDLTIQAVFRPPKNLAISNIVCEIIEPDSDLPCFAGKNIYEILYNRFTFRLLNYIFQKKGKKLLI